jgi:toxin ParE1/3/4
VPRLRLAASARDDLREIRIYSKSAFGARVAREYLDGLRAIFTFLRERPLIGTAEEDLGALVRGYTYRAHRIYYRADDEEVLIGRIVHHARDIRAIRFDS